MANFNLEAELKERAEVLEGKLKKNKVWVALGFIAGFVVGGLFGAILF